MACASQSALDYVQSARDHLVRTLEGLAEIVENLKQKGVFSEEEVSKIKTEGDDFDKTGIIVDSVIKKGEETCYEFLRIIDITRKKSGERPPSFLENAELPSSPCNTFDLNYWISCFSFKEDVNMDVTYSQDPEPCHRYQLKLKSEAQKISERSWTQSKAVLFNKQSSLSYTSLVLDTQGQASPSKIKKSKIKKSRKLRPKKLKTYIPENKPGTSPDELLKSYEKNILLVGKPGVGKTAVVHQMLKLWSEKDKDLDYMFYFDMRETPTITEVHKLEDLLFGVFSEPDEGKDEVLEDIKNNADSVTIIFDGVTDVPSTSVVFKLIQKTLLREAKIIITCRPEDESADFLLDWDCLRVEVKGFSEQGIREYLSKNLSEEHLNQVLCNLELFTLCHVPMYALMVAACFSFEGSDFSPHPCTVTEIYLNILHICIQRNVCKTSENERSVSSAMLSLAEAAFRATEEKNVNLKSLPQLDSCVHLSFLNMFLIQVGPTVKKPLCAFLHYTVQEFFAVLWVLKDPERTRGVLQQCLTEDTKHMKHLVPFLCGLLNEKNTDFLESLIPSQQLRDTSGWFFKDLVKTFVDRSEDCEIDLVFLCQCLYESQSAEACLCLLDKLDYYVDLSGEALDPQRCCAVSYVISQSEERKIQLNLEDATVSAQGMRSLLGCLNKLQRSDSLSQQLWTLCLLSEGEVDYRSLLCFDKNQLHLPVNSKTQLYDRAVKVLQKSAEKVEVCLHWDWRVCQHVNEVLLQCLPNIHSVRFCRSSVNLSDQRKFLMNLFIGAAEREQQTGEKILNMLSSVCRGDIFILFYPETIYYYISLFPCDFLLDLYSRVKDYETQTGRSVLPSLQSVFQSAPAVWFIKLSETKTSILLEVLKLQSEKKAVELIGCSYEESEVRSFLQCVPYISQLSFCYSVNLSDQTEFLMNLFIGAAEREQQTGEKILNMLSSVCSHQRFPLHELYMRNSAKKHQSDFLLDLYSRVKDYETQTGRSVLPSLQSVLSAPAVWFIKLSETKTSILLEVLKLQSEKKAVELIGCSYEESEVRSFLQCVPYISQLSFCYSVNLSDQTEFLMNLFIGAAEREQQTGEKILNMLSSVCSYPTFPFQFDDDDDDHQYRLDFLLDLYSRVKDYETQTGRSVLPSLQSVFQSAPAVWFIKLSETKTSILLEVLKLQSEKKAVELIGCSYEESEVRSFLQCVPYISQLSFCYSVNLSDQTEFLMNLFIGAAEREQQTGEKILNMLSSVCSYPTFPFQFDDDDDDHQYRLDFLLDLYSRVKDYETQTGRSVLPSLQSVFQSAPAVWFIKLSETKTSILLEVLKLQSEKKAVELIGCSYEESEVRSFLQCVPYISQLSFCYSVNLSDQTEFLMNLFIGAAEREQQTGEKILNMLSSVCSYPTFPFQFDDDDDDHQYRLDFLLDLYSRVKDYETQTGRSVLPSLQSVFQSAPAVWFIKLSETKTSILLEVLKLQSEKKAVELIGCSYEESEVRSFLQCVPYISQLSFCYSVNLSDQTEFLMNLFIGAAEREQQTGEKILNMLSSVCSHQRFPLHELYMRNSAKKHQSDFLLDLYSRVKDYETQTGRSVLPSLQSVLSAPAVWFINLSETKTSILLEVLKLQSEKKAVELIGCSYEESEVRSFLQCVPYISQLSFCYSVNLSDQTEFLMNLFIGAAEREQQTGEKILNMLSSVCSHQRFPLHELYMRNSAKKHQSDFLLDLYSRVKDYETQTGRSVLPSLQSVLSAPAVWFIKLSETKTSILLEVLKLQSEKKAVELIGCSYEESEVRSFLQCVPYISQLSFCYSVNLSDQTEFLMNLFIGAAEREQQTGEKILNMLSSVCSHQRFPLHELYMRNSAKKHQSDFLLDLYSRVKDYETQTGRSVLPSLQSVLSAPAVWFINLSETKTSILLEVLKLQSEKKAVELIGCSYEESEVRSFLQCVPYISQLSFCYSVNLSDQTEFLMNLFIGAAEREQQTGEKILNMLSSVCSYPTFPFQFDDDDDDHQYRLDFLLDLYSRVKDYETQTGRSVLPSLQSVFQSAPAVWFIKLSETKTSILLEVLKLQSEKKAVELIGCSYEESEVRSFLQCVPYISQLSFCYSVNLSDQTEFLMNLFIGAAEREQQTGEKILNMLSSVCSYPTFPFQFDDDDDDHQYRLDFLLDLYSRVKDYETQTGRSVLPSLQSVFQSAPAVWFIKLSETKTSILLEVLKLQSEKKAVELIGCSYEESEVRSFLQCVPYISQLSFCYSVNLSDQTEFLMNLFIGAAEREQQTGEKILNMLSSVCSHQRFPLHELYMRNSAKKHQSDFLLDLYSRVKDYETQTGRSVLPSLQSVLSAPAVWFINLSETKTSILLEVLKLQSEKKAVELIGCSYEESEVRSFLQCVPYISQLSFCYSVNLSDQTEFLMNLFIGAAEREQQTGEKILNMLSSVCSHQRFPLHELYMRNSAKKHQSDFLLDLYSRVKDYETQTGRSVLPSLQSVFQSAPAVWFIKLSETKTSILLEVLKLQSEKKAVELIGCSYEESEVRSFLQCVPYISQLSCDPGFFQSVCTSFAVTSEQEVQQMSSLLQLLDFNLLLTGWLSSETCTFVGRVLGFCGSKVNLSLTCRKMSVRGASLLFKHTPHIRSLRLSSDLVLLLLQWVRAGEVSHSLIIEELSVIESMTYQSEKVLLSVVSSVASLLRSWTVRQLDLSELCIPTQHLTALLRHHGSLTIRVNKENLQQLPALLHEIQDQELTQCFFSKVGGDLTSCFLDWEVLYFLLQHSSGQTITVNLKKISSVEENFSHLLPFLDRVVFKRPSPSFVLSAIRHIHEARSSHSVPSLLRSLDHVISLTCTELDSVDFSALLFILHHSDVVKLNLLWTSIPAENIESLLFTLDKVSQLSVDRTLLLRLVHCCAAAQQRASSVLLGALQHRLDLSCSSFMDLAEEEQREALRLTAADCWSISTILGYSSQETQLDLRDCEVGDNGMDALLPVLDRVRLRASKALLLQLLSLIPQRDSVRWAESLWRALDGELDLSHTTLDQGTCSSLAQVLDSSEGVTELDLSHCQLTDQLLSMLIPQLHKVQVLDLSHNNLTDVSTNMLLCLTSISSCSHTVRVFGNSIEDKRPFTDKRFEIW